MDTVDATNNTSRKNEREEDSFSDDDVAVHSVRFKRKKIEDTGSAGGGQGTVGGASANGTAITAAAAAGKGSGLYLDTIRRYMLDFDFEKVCSVSLSNLNVYACLVCGKYFQGRGTTSHAYFHSLHENHHVYINLNTLKVYVLPDSYEVTDSSLDDIKYVLDPRFTHTQVKTLDKNSSQSFDLNRKPYIPGFIGLNNIKANDYVNVVVQVLAHIPHIRDYFMLQKFDDKSELVKRFGTLVRKIWNPSAFKGQVSPHELLQEISNASNRQFKLTEQSDPLAFLSWFLNTLHKDLGGTRKKDSSIIYTTFQGEVSIETQSIDPKAVKGVELAFNSDDAITKTKSPFLFLALELPPPPLFHDELEKNIIPQIPLTTILSKYDGKTLQESVADLKKFQITRLPNYIIFHIKRFSKNSFVKEKNPTIVTFPIKNLSMGEFIADPEKEKQLGLHYDLLANITHVGDPSIPNSTSYKVHVQHRAKEQWYQIQDLFVEEINAQMIFLSESYIQVRGPFVIFYMSFLSRLSFIMFLCTPCLSLFVVWFGKDYLFSTQGSLMWCLLPPIRIGHFVHFFLTH
ncbi:MAG: ubiquitin carboxyl-terminal hydrolase, partial [Linnemannia gamsii]